MFNTGKLLALFGVSPLLIPSQLVTFVHGQRRSGEIHTRVIRTQLPEHIVHPVLA